ncbi:hypothetical protein Glove_228g109 [Diversispora epigaea]|uniref:Uncharacterized protein n=1 Tax=Diversispora epigaea TaxID=1348612 RepID=A0A397IL15_9GLOM|nr:hypothetical protein Glove_228g109 [Diversispora epigaea]
MLYEGSSAENVWRGNDGNDGNDEAQMMEMMELYNDGNDWSLEIQDIQAIPITEALMAFRRRSRRSAKTLTHIFGKLILELSRMEHSEVYNAARFGLTLENILITLDGKPNEKNALELFYLDLSKSFDNTNLKWNKIREDEVDLSESVRVKDLIVVHNISNGRISSYIGFE